MRNVDKIKSKSLDEFAEWLDKYGAFDDSPWLNWWNENYCSKCDSEVIKTLIFENETECAWCELHNKCRFFQDMDEVPDSKQMIKMWLESEC